MTKKFQNAVSFVRGLLFAQFQRETIQNKKLTQGLAPWQR